MLADLEDRHDSRMIELCGGFRLGVETLNVFVPSKLTRQDHLERDGAVQIDLPCFEDHAHAAAGDFLQ